MPRFYLQVNQVGQPTRRVELAGTLVVGRESTADLQIKNDDLVSRRHLRLHVAGEHVDVEVLGTTNTTTLDDETITAGHRIVVPYGGRLRIGRTTLVLVAAISQETTHDYRRRPRMSHERPSTVLVPNHDLETAAKKSNAWVLLKGTSSRRRRSNQLVAANTTVGSGSACDFVIAHESVDERHASLLCDGLRWFLTDLGSKEGTRVDGQRIGLTPVALRRNNLVHFGAVAAVFVCQYHLSATEDPREEDHALRHLVARGRLSADEMELIANRTLGGHGNYHAAVLMHETEIEPEEWVDAILLVRQKPGVLGKLGNKLANWFGAS